MKGRRNIIWIMADQLRWDYLSCYGHPTLKTPNMDKLAAKGVRFTNAYVQSPICGPSRMSYYTGRYVRSHGSTWNGFPLKVGELTLGDHLRDVDVRSVLVGKTHMIPDAAGMRRLGIEPESDIGALVSECGFEPFDRDDGVHPTGYLENEPPIAYQDYLRAHGMGGDNPWELWANSAEGPDGSLLSGWLMENAHLPARVPAEHSETAYMTTRAIEFLQSLKDDKPWLCHLSYIKPHWPYLAPAPYNDMYSTDDMVAPVRSAAELESAHPFLAFWRKSLVNQNFAKVEVRDRVGPVYMGLIKQLDDEIGRLLQALKDMGRDKDTIIVISSDHGDNLGDHWMGEKDLFYDSSTKVPLIIYDPSEQMDAARGTVCSDLVEGIDLAPTFLDLFGGDPRPHIMEGRSLLPILRGDRPKQWRDHVFSEYDYSLRPARRQLEVPQEDARTYMIFDGRWKMIYVAGFRPILFDLSSDPDELVDRGDDIKTSRIRTKLFTALREWGLKHHTRTTLSPDTIEKMAAAGEAPGVLIGYWDEGDLKAQNKPLYLSNV